MTVIVIYGEEEQRVVFENIEGYSVHNDVLTLTHENGEAVMFNWACVSAVGEAALIEAIE